MLKMIIQFATSKLRKKKTTDSNIIKTIRKYDALVDKLNKQ